MLFNNGKRSSEDAPELNNPQTADYSEVLNGEEPSEEAEVTIPVPPVAEPFFGLKNRIAYFGFSQRGKSHIASQMPCQDRCCSAYVPETNHLIFAVADGVGSCALSDLGAATAVHAVVDFIQKGLVKTAGAALTSTAAGSLLREAMQYAFEQVERAAVENEQLLYSLQSTLTVAIYDGTDLYFAHAGDDGIVALTEEGTLALATARHKGEEASSVYPLQSKSTWQFGMVPRTVAFVLATDGVLDAFVRSSYEKDRVYYPFIEPIFTARYGSGQDVERTCKELYAYMNGDAYRSAVTDDLTITVAMNLDKLSACLPEFDLDAWNEDTKTYEEMRRNALYSQKTEPQQAPDVGTGPSAGAPQQPAAQEPTQEPAAQAPVQTTDPSDPSRDPWAAEPPRDIWNTLLGWIAGWKLFFGRIFKRKRKKNRHQVPRTDPAHEPAGGQNPAPHPQNYQNRRRPGQTQGYPAAAPARRKPPRKLDMVAIIVWIFIILFLVMIAVMTFQLIRLFSTFKLLFF